MFMCNDTFVYVCPTKSQPSEYRSLLVDLHTFSNFHKTINSAVIVNPVFMLHVVGYLLHVVVMVTYVMGQSFQSHSLIHCHQQY